MVVGSAPVKSAAGIDQAVIASGARPMERSKRGSCIFGYLEQNLISGSGDTVV